MDMYTRIDIIKYSIVLTISILKYLFCFIIFVVVIRFKIL